MRITPRRRRAHGACHRMDVSGGITPARAGSTAPPRGCRTVGRDYPRMRREHPLPGVACNGPMGITPRARGALRVRIGDTVPLRITPRAQGAPVEPLASASMPGSPPSVWGAPRGRAAAVGTDWITPRVRGTRAWPPPAVPLEWIIPECAGSTGSGPAPCGPSGDHPRVRGEHITAIGDGDVQKGSPPRMQGAGAVRLRGRAPVGITPACARSTRDSGASVRERWDHPRMLGERCQIGWPVVSLSASPRVRGEHGVHPFDNLAVFWDHPACAGALAAQVGLDSLLGFTPTSAGSTCRRSPGEPWARDRPLVRASTRSLLCRRPRGEITLAFVGSTWTRT